MLKQRLKRVIGFFYRKMGISLGYEPLCMRVPILMYHSVHPEYAFSVTPDNFIRQVEYLAENYNVITLGDLVTSIEQNKLIKNPLVITFDDGYVDNYEYAWKILSRFGVKATIFICSGFVNGEVDITRKFKFYRGLKPLSWGAIKEMHASGINFGSHSHTHPNFGKIILDAIKIELKRSKELLETHLIDEISLFAFPYGWPGTYNNGIIRLLEDEGYVASCINLWGTNYVTSTQLFDRYRLKRIRIDVHDTLEDFINKVEGYWDYMEYLQKLKALTNKL